jgi:peptide/nickel transport system ATP-binding protein
MRLLPQPMGRILGGEVWFEGRDLLQMSDADIHDVRGAGIGMIFQEPMTALNPVHRVGRQITEALLLHYPDMTPQAAVERAVGLLTRVGIPSPEIRIGEYPHQLSGGMRQRVMIAIALACRPALVIADEPTTALDVTIQAQILALLRELQAELGMSVILITHDLGVIAETCDDVLVMYAGRVAEYGSAVQIFGQPRHPYTQGLLASIPRLEHPRKQRLPVIEGMVPDLAELPRGCRFQNRCPYREDRCRRRAPPLEAVETGHTVSCLRHRELESRQ